MRWIALRIGAAASADRDGNCRGKGCHLHGCPRRSAGEICPPTMTRSAAEKSTVSSHRCERLETCRNIVGNAWLSDRRVKSTHGARKSAGAFAMRWSAVACAVGLVAIGCPPAGAQVFHSSAGDVAVETVAKNLDHPWAIAFLPAGRMLVTERPGRMRIVAKDGALSPALAGVPKVFASGQGGLLDVALDRGFAQNHTIYFCYAEPVDGRGRTALARARLVDEGTPRLDAVEVIFRQAGPLSSGNDLGKIIRIRPDGSVPPDNPFVGRPAAKPEIWSYGHRNPQGLAFHPVTGKLWEHEHGPRGGDEINIIEKGKNYGWPVIGYGIDYNGAKIHESTHKQGMEQPLKYWVPSIAPSGMAFYTGSLLPAWRGNLFVGALAGQLLVRLEIEG